MQYILNSLLLLINATLANFCLQIYVDVLLHVICGIEIFVIEPITYALLVAAGFDVN